MMTELVLVEGTSDVQLISYYLQRVYGWQHIEQNAIGIKVIEKKEHIESLAKNGSQLVLCGVGGNAKFAHFVKEHRVNTIVQEKEISSVMVVTDRDNDSIPKISRTVNEALSIVSFQVGTWNKSTVTDLFGMTKSVDTYLMIIPAHEKGALEKVIINALQDIPEEKELIASVIAFIDSLKVKILPELTQINKANKATVGTFFSVRNPKDAMRTFSSFISKIHWEESDSLKVLFAPFAHLGTEKPTMKS